MLVKLKNKSVIKITAGYCILALAVFLILPLGVHAAAASDTINSNLGTTLQPTGLQNGDVRVIIGNIIKAFLGVLGIIAIILVIYAGFLYMTAGGDPEKTKRAIGYLKDAAIGLAIIFSSYAIASFIISRLLGIGDGSLGISGSGSLGSANYSLSGGAFGSVIMNQFPLPEAQNVPRNTMVLVTFKIPINVDTVIDKSNRSACPPSAGANCGALKTAFKVFRCADMPGFPTGA
ncbi:MAG: pilin, partial [Parcubacteria group bacterium]